MTLDFVSKRYGKLPSELLVRGSSLDIQIAEVAVGYENYLSRKAKGEAPMAQNYSQDQLKSMIQAVRSKQDGNKD